VDSETHRVLTEMLDYLAKQREHRARNDGMFQSDVFGAVYAAVNRLGWLDKSLPPRTGAGHD